MPPYRSCLALLATTTALLAQPRLTPDEALLWLQKGNDRFVSSRLDSKPLDEGARRTLAKGQHPRAVVWTCADSRVAPEHLFNAGLGEVFVVRTAGNACDPESLASVEYTVEHLDAPLVVVLGHSGCGAVAAALADAKATPAIRRVLERIAPAVQRARRDALEGKELLAAAVVENVYQTTTDAQMRSTALRVAMQQGRLKIVPARYDLESGAITWLPERPVQMAGATKSPAHHLTPAFPPHTVLGMLQAGHRRFVTGHGGKQDLSAARRQELAEGQHPSAVVVTCADSRVAPEHVFDCGLGDLFVVRVAGNVLDDSVQASVEYAVEHLGASLVLWMGHAGCGAVKAACESGAHTKLSDSMRRLLEHIAPAVERARGAGPADRWVAAAIDQNVLQAVAELRKGSELVRELEQHGKLAVVPLVYEIDSGDLRWLDVAEPHAAPGAEVAHGSAERATHDAQEPAHEDSHAGPHGGTQAAVEPEAAPVASDHRTLVVTLGIAMLVATAGVVLFGTLRRR